MVGGGLTAHPTHSTVLIGLDSVKIKVKHMASGYVRTIGKERGLYIPFSFGLTRLTCGEMETIQVYAYTGAYLIAIIWFYVCVYVCM